MRERTIAVSGKLKLRLSELRDLKVPLDCLLLIFFLTSLSSKSVIPIKSNALTKSSLNEFAISVVRFQVKSQPSSYTLPCEDVGLKEAIVR